MKTLLGSLTMLSLVRKSNIQAVTAPSNTLHRFQLLERRYGFDKRRFRQVSYLGLHMLVSGIADKS